MDYGLDSDYDFNPSGPTAWDNNRVAVGVGIPIPMGWEWEWE